MQLYLNSTVKHLHYAGSYVVAFLLSLTLGNTVSQAYQGATGIADPRNAYRWLTRYFLRLSHYRSLSHQPIFDETGQAVSGAVLPRRRLLDSTFRALLERFGEPLCELYQQELQTSLL